MSSQRSLASRVLIVGMLLTMGVSQTAADEPQRTAEEWIHVWDAGKFGESQNAKKALAEMGAAAVPALARLVRDNHRHSGYALKTLADMGAAARPVLPELLKLAKNKAAKEPDGWTWNVPIRTILFMSLGKMSWASAELVPLLEHVGKDEQETEQIRGAAVNALRGMGSDAMPALRRFATGGSAQVRRSAVNAIVEIEVKAGKERTTSLQEIIDRDPFDSNIPMYLADMKRIYNLGHIHPPTQAIKELYRRELKKQPNPQVAWQLATIIRNGLVSSELKWSAPSNSYSSLWNREDPDENYDTLDAAMKIAFEHSEAKSV
ncbi:MAG: hypothetical protein O3A00_16635 [Planctomycetota bacterium]|nr:hypothetical protein [Planctomycetota bacterium]